MTTTYKASPAPRLTVKSTRELSSSQFHVLIYGKTKSGKTTTSVTLEKDPKHNAIICTQPEAQLSHLGALGIPYVVVRSAVDLEDALRDPRALFPDMRTLIIDDMTEAAEMKRLSLDQNDQRKGYKDTATWVGERLKFLLSQPFNLVITAFERMSQGETSLVPSIAPDFPAGVGFEVTSKMDFILRMEDYKLRIKPSEAKRIEAGNRWPKSKVGQLSEHVEPDLAKLWASFQEAIK
jgi:hypothetical protein